MRSDFTAPFETARNKKAHEPVTLIQLDFPAVAGFPALTLRLAERGSASDESKLSIGGNDWHAVIEDAGDIDRLIDATQFSANSDADLSVTVVNLPTDLFSPAQPFAWVFRDRPPESATAIVYQWFEGEGLGAGDLAELFRARVADPVEYDEATCSFDLVNISLAHGQVSVGNAITLTDYPNAPESALGRMKPIVIGDVSDVPGVLVRDAGRTQIKSVASPGDTTLDVRDTSSFPSSGTLKVNDDEISYTGKISQQFTGVSGVDEFHFADDEVIEKLTDHRYLFSDPAYPVKAIDNVKVQGEPADPADYSVDLANGEVVFNTKPEDTKSTDTKFLQAQFDATTVNNNALDPLNATDPDAKTSFAKISQANPTLALEQTDAMPDIGPIGKVKVRLEHFVEEKLPNDSVTVDIAGVGQIGTASPPSTEDQADVAGSTDITHDHLDTFGFPITDPQHQHPLPRKTTIFQDIVSGVQQEVIRLQSSVEHDAVFNSLPAGTIEKIRYIIDFTADAQSGSAPIIVLVRHLDNFGETFEVWRWDSPPSTFTKTTSFTFTSVFDSTLTFYMQADSVDFQLHNASREITLTPEEDVDLRSTGTSTSKQGDVTQHTSSPALSATTEKATKTVVDFFDITGQVGGDWSWFQNKEVQVKYNGSLDGRTAFIIHVAFEIEFARRSLDFTDEVTADVQGVKDDGSGTITGTADALLERPDHVFEWLIRDVLGLGGSAIDSASFSAAGTDYANAFTGGYKLAGVIARKIQAGELWRDWEKNCRSYFFWERGTARIEYRPLNGMGNTLTSDKTITSAMIRLDEDGRARLRVERTSVSNIINTIDLRYNRIWADFLVTQDPGEEENAYGAVESVSDAWSITRYQKKEKPDEFKFDWTRGSAQAADLAVFFLAQHRDPNELLEFEAFLDNLELERGDVVTISPPTHEDANRPGLVLGAGRVFGSGAAGRMDAVPVTLQLMDTDAYGDVYESGSYGG